MDDFYRDEDYYIPSNAGYQQTFFNTGFGPGDYEDVNNPIGSDGDFPVITNPIENPGDSTVGGGEPGRDVNVVGPGGEDLETSGVVQKDGKYYDSTGRLLYDPTNLTGGLLGSLSKILGPNAYKNLKSLFINKDDSINLAGLGTLGAGLYSLLDSQKKDSGGGYSTPVQVKSAYREAIEQPSRPTGAPAMGRRYFTDVQYLPKGDTAALDAAKAAAAAQKADLTMEPNASIRSIEPSIIPTKWNKPVETKTEQAAATSGLPAIPNALEIAQQTYPKETTTLASGGIAQMKNPRYLRGTTDGMADKIPSSIDNKQPAALSHGEFVIPADVVAHLGNGNSEAGAKKLYEMMSRVRKARTGNEKQGKKINPEKFMPGGLAALAAGGEVRRFNNGGGVTSGGAGGVTLDTSKTSSLSPWVGDYVTTALGEASGLAAMPFQSYKGPLAAGASDLQTKAFAGAEGIASAGFDPTKYTTQSFTADQANKYMNPYLSAALDPQMKELRRQAQITNLGSLAKAGRAGIMSGDSRNLMEAENMRNLLSKQSDVLGTGYATAYDKAMDQFNKEQGRVFEAEKASEDSRKYSADFGFKSLAELARLGQTQRDIEAEKIAADKAAFEEERGYAYKMPQYKLSLLGGLPTGTTTSTTDTSGLPGLMQNLSGLASIYEMLGKLGVK